LRQVAAQTILDYGQARGRTWLLDVARLADQELLQVLLLAGA
jgi:hypothetical protein